MTDAAQPYISSVNLVVRDMAAALAFYRRLGLAFPLGAEQRPHVATQFPGGLSLEFDTRDLTRAYDADWQEPAGGSGAIVQFMLPSPAAVDALFAELTGEGHRGHLQPFDAFWGARYAAVLDPDGNLIGLTSPQDEGRSGPPPSI